ncbi:MAG TPA: acyl-CoA desaturase [Candidatus Thermoplasmatota archaeon]|nr:acyl-CoA desaturase [Candidatus Thermoplasmatota archaeon]
MEHATREGAPVAASRLEKAILLAAVILPLVGTLYAIVLLWNRLVSWTDIALLVGFYVLTALGIGTGYHRMLTHRGFEAPAPVRAFWLILGSMALQGPAVEWAATHTKHHAKADTEEDPHTPLAGFWHAHTGWLFRDRIVRSGVWAKPFLADPVVVWVDKTFFVWATLGFVIPFLIGGWTGLLWGGLVRVFLVHHVTWSVNSVCHMFGSRPFATKDESRNEWIVGLLALGEGWHNNHHAAPKVAIHGFRWWQVDVNGLIIRAMARLRLIRNVVRPTAEMRKGRRSDEAPATVTLAALPRE